MPTSLVFSSHGFCMAAADTKADLIDGCSGIFTANGSSDLMVDIPKKNSHERVAHRMRKIASIGMSWGATAGDNFTGATSLSILKTLRVDNPFKAMEELRLRKDVILENARTVGSADSESLNTRLMIATPEGTTWHCLLNDLRFVEQTGPSSYAIEIPPSVNQSEHLRLIRNWTEKLNSGLLVRNIAQILRATVALIYRVHIQAACTGPRAQIGFTSDFFGSCQKHYLDDECSVILNSSDKELFKMICEVE